MRTWTTILTLLCTLTLVAQNKTKIDSLLKTLATNKEDTNRINSLNELAKVFLDTLPDKSLVYTNQALELTKKLKWKKGEVVAYRRAASVYMRKEEYVKSLEYDFKILKAYEEEGNKKKITSALGNIGLFYVGQGDYPHALDYWIKAVDNEEQIWNEIHKSPWLYNIGNLYQYQSTSPFLSAKKKAKLSEKIMGYYLKALQSQKKEEDKAIWSYYIGNVYKDQSRIQRDSTKKGELLDSALTCYFQAFEYDTAIQRHSSILGNIGITYHEQGNYERALNWYRRALGEHKDNAQIYSRIGALYTETKKYKEAEKYLLQALELNQEQSTAMRRPVWMFDELNSELALATLYRKTKKWDKAFEHYEKAMTLQDSIFDDEKDKKLNRMELQNKFDKEQERQLREQEKKDAVAAEEMKRQKMLGYAFMGGFGLLLVLAFVVFLSLQQKKKANKVIIAQKELVEEKNAEILDSIQYAKRIQSAILPPPKLVRQYLEDSFILYKPKDIVAGDFYWMETEEDKVFFTAADCTGHGVPGAMVSVMCSNALSKAVKELGIYEPAKILDKTVELLEERFAKSEEEVKDGMDLALCCLDLKTQKLEYAGANNSLYYIKNGELKEVKPDKQPVGKHDGRQPYTNHTLDIKKGDCFYIFSDGFADQFGGPKGKKFMYKPFKKLLSDIHDKPMDEQKDILDRSIIEWKGPLEQVDDICIIGLRI